MSEQPSACIENSADLVGGWEAGKQQQQLKRTALEQLYNNSTTNNPQIMTKSL